MEKFKKDILNLLCEDSRYTADKIAVMLGKPPADVKAAIKDMEQSGVIVKYSALISGERAGLDTVEALIEVRVTPQKSKGFDNIAAEIYRFPEVRSCYLMSGGFDLAVFIAGKTLKEVAMFVSEKLSILENVVATSTHFILKKYKLEGVVTEEQEDVKRIPFNP